MDFILLASIYGAMAIMGGALWYFFKNTVLAEEAQLSSAEGN
jgi:hypothetical protein